MTFRPIFAASIVLAGGVFWLGGCGNTIDLPPSRDSDFYSIVESFNEGAVIFLQNISSTTTATSVSPTEIVIRWTSVRGAGFYSVERSGAPDGGFSEIRRVAGNTTMYSDRSLTPATTFFYRVRAGRTFSNGTIRYTPYSNIVSATTGPVNPPTPTATPGATATATPTPTATPGVTATPRATATPTPTPTAIASSVHFYIDATLGNDANDGKSPSAAWKTLVKIQSWNTGNAWSSIKPGDSILLKRGERWAPSGVPGSYGAIEIPIGKAGAPDAYITLGSYGNSALPLPIISMLNSPMEKALAMRSASYFIIRDIEFRGQIYLRSRYDPGIHHIKFLNITVDGAEGAEETHLVTTWDATEVSAENWDFYDTHDIEIGYSTFKNTNYGASIHFVVTTGNAWIHHNKILDPVGDPSASNTRGTCLDFAEGNNLLIEYNICSNPNGNGFKLQPQRYTLDNITVRGNLITNVQDIPLIIYNTRNSSIYHNTIVPRSSSAFYAFYMGWLTGTTDSTPTIYFSGKGQWGFQDSKIQNNIFGGVVWIGTPNGVNITYKDGTYVPSYTHSLNSIKTKNYFQNNLYFSQLTTTRIREGYYTSNTTIKWDPNASPPGYAIISDSITKTIASAFDFNTAWLGTSPTITGEKTADPLFVNPSAGNYHLQTGSPAINSGISIPEWTVDLDGNPVIGTPTIGAYQ
ncbi:MAG: hypothetical protein V1495_00260 [Pseudomonadota bacterium]